MICFSQEVSASVTLENPNGADFQFGSPNPNEVEVRLIQFTLSVLLSVQEIFSDAFYWCIYLALVKSIQHKTFLVSRSINRDFLCNSHIFFLSFIFSSFLQPWML